MAWNQIIGQGTIVRMLQRSIAARRVPQGLLLTGEDGAGALAIAVAMARVLACEEPIIKDVSVEACSKCHSCIQARTLQHPNIKVVTALPTGKADTEDGMTAAVLEELSDQLRTIAEDAYVPLLLNKATQIKIGQIRDLKRQLSLSSAQGGRRVVIINHADEMTVGAANAFLKTLEEPHDDVTIILTTSKPERLLPTIVSRCQEIVVPPLDDKEIIDSLVKDKLAERDEATLITPFAEGSITRARNFLTEDVASDRADAVELLRASLRGRQHRIALLAAVRNVAASRDKTKAIRALSLLSLWIRDAQIITLAGSDATIVNLDQREALQRFAASFPTANLESVLSSIEAAVTDLHRNVSITSVLLTTMMKARSVIRRGRAQKSGAIA